VTPGFSLEQSRQLVFGEEVPRHDREDETAVMPDVLATVQGRQQVRHHAVSFERSSTHR
jgi:hypothetical protein